MAHIMGGGRWRLHRRRAIEIACWAVRDSNRGRAYADLPHQYVLRLWLALCLRATTGQTSSSWPSKYPHASPHRMGQHIVEYHSERGFSIFESRYGRSAFGWHTLT